jgi:hypothetical protein
MVNMHMFNNMCKYIIRSRYRRWRQSKHRYLRATCVVRPQVQAFGHTPLMMSEIGSERARACELSAGLYENSCIMPHSESQGRIIIAENILFCDLFRRWWRTTFDAGAINYITRGVVCEVTIALLPSRMFCSCLQQLRRASKWRPTGTPLRVVSWVAVLMGYFFLSLSRSLSRSLSLS